MFLKNTVYLLTKWLMWHGKYLSATMKPQFTLNFDYITIIQFVHF